MFGEVAMQELIAQEIETGIGIGWCMYTYIYITYAYPAHRNTD